MKKLIICVCLLGIIACGKQKTTNATEPVSQDSVMVDTIK